MENKFGPLNIESRASHYPEGSPVMIIERTKAETAAALDREKPLPSSEAEPVTEPVPSELESKSTESYTEQASQPDLPATGSPLPLIGLSGVLSMLAAAGIRLRRR
jgi:LPXTG-motif cell wall-anchored protein